MSELRIVEINDPQEFVEKIQIDQNDELYVYLEDIFTPIGDIYDHIIKIYKDYKCALMFTDIKTVYNSVAGYQYFNDVQHNQQRRVIYSPLIARYAPIPLEIHPELTHHSFSFLSQAIKHVLPWHIPRVGFSVNIDQQQFQKLAEDSAWVMQQGA